MILEYLWQSKVLWRWRLVITSFVVEKRIDHFKNPKRQQKNSSLHYDDQFFRLWLKTHKYSFDVVQQPKQSNSEIINWNFHMTWIKVILMGLWTCLINISVHASRPSRISDFQRILATARGQINRKNAFVDSFERFRLR